MNTTKLNDWLGIATNIGVIVGLALVAYEINQTNQAMSLDHRAQLIEITATGREGWQNFASRIIDSEEVADIWLRGGQGKELTEQEAERFRWLADDLFYLEIQQYNQYSRTDGSPADWAIDQLADFLRAYPGVNAHVSERYGSSSSEFMARLRARHPGLLE